MAFDYWLKGDIPPGPVKAILITDVAKAVDIIKKFKNLSIILLGSYVENIEKTLGVNIIEKIVEIAKIINAPITTSSSETVRRFDEIMFTNYKIMFPLELIQNLSRDSIYKLVIVAGFRYSYGWLLLNHLKHYRPDLNTFSIDPYAQPNASWTMPSLPLSLWFKNLTQIVEILKSQLT